MLHLLSRATQVPVFLRAPFIFILVIFFWGINVFVFNKYKINYARVLNLSPEDNKNLKGSDIIFASGLFFLLLFSCLSLYLSDLASANSAVPIEIYPMIFYLLMIFLLLLPIDSFHQETRRYLLERIKRLVIFNKTKASSSLDGELPFEDRFFADILTSLSKALADTEVTMCVLISHLKSPTKRTEEARPGCIHSLLLPVVVSLPFLVRIRQCHFVYQKKKNLEKFSWNGEVLHCFACHLVFSHEEGLS
eukprot:TRINITY_DN9769_c0_g1_i1.p1 TRINITY_DN9769_c0_g1~~TRINITY_DN9769_c0_g1_i1.p1  ORF type:complete len:249 (-),score=39.60 TRINITY_DN9769_c0_g1_i1:128-874(-)